MAKIRNPIIMVGGGATVQLYAPTISLSGLTLTITNSANNGAFVEGYDIYSGSTKIGTTTSTTYDLATSSGMTSGSNSITVKAIAQGFIDSASSNAETVSIYTVTNTLSNITTSNSANVVLASGSYSATLTPATGWTYGTTTVTMGGNDITSTAYDNGVITIASVTGNIVVTATAYVPVTNTLTGVTNSNGATAVAYGSSYTGTITVSSGYTMEGATISITMGGVDITSTVYSNGTITIASVTGAVIIEISAVATGPVFDRTFGNNTPETISAVSQIISAQNMTASDVANTYGWNLGDTVDITLTTNEVIQMQIIGINHDTLSSDHITKAGLTLQMKNCLSTVYSINTEQTNAGGWNASTFRTNTVPILLNSLPSDWQNVIKTVDKQSANGGSSNYSGIVTSSDTLFLLSGKEILGSTSYAEHGANEGTRYAYWSANSSSNARIKKLNGSNIRWWLRSSYQNLLSFCWIDNWGSEAGGLATNNQGISFAFCV